MKLLLSLFSLLLCLSLPAMPTEQELSKALASNSLAGLQRVAAEKRIAEAESAVVGLAV